MNGAEKDSGRKSIIAVLLQDIFLSPFLHPLRASANPDPKTPLQKVDWGFETATTVDEAKELLKVGFDYIAEKDGIMLFRRPKRFGSLGVTGES